jgi:hypothetical protein
MYAMTALRPLSSLISMMLENFPFRCRLQIANRTPFSRQMCLSAPTAQKYTASGEVAATRSPCESSASQCRIHLSGFLSKKLASQMMDAILRSI